MDHRGGLYGCVLVGGLVAWAVTGDPALIVVAIGISAALEWSLHRLGGGDGRDRRH